MAVAVLLVLGVVTAWSVLIPGVSAWENIVVALIGSLRITGPVAAAFAAWVAVRRRRGTGGRALTAWQAVRAPLAILVVVMGSFTATVLVLAVRTMLTEQAGRLLPSGLIMSVAGLALYVTIGWVTGWLLPWTITPALAGLGCYALFSWLAGRSAWTDRLVPATREPYDLFQGLSSAAFTDQTLWLVGVSAALLLGWAAVVTRQTLVLAAALLAVLAAGTGVARLLDDPRPVAAERVVYSCQEWPIRVCVHPGMRNGLDELGSAFIKIASRLAGTPGEFSRVEQRPRHDDTSLAPGAVPVHVDDLATGFADRAAGEFVESLAEKCDGTPAGGYRDIVTAWLRGEPLPGGPLPEHQYAAAWFSALSETQRRGWLRLHYADFAGCRLQAAHFGAQAPQAAGAEEAEEADRPERGGRDGGAPHGEAGQAPQAEVRATPWTTPGAEIPAAPQTGTPQAPWQAPDGEGPAAPQARTRTVPDAGGPATPHGGARGRNGERADRETPRQ
ncbi:hypothetical protein [Planomonospora venezuelensis]|uniref:Uncharacterized protein n=1 Tax=Planomonospora venezuelensis TaxID=1999 RepID=A0A841D6B8_PLAVE|nr:hypothetical protein [Planomonospora venezuelensis]